MENTHTIFISPQMMKILKKLNEVACKDVSRLALNYLHFCKDEDNCMIEGTDGIVLGWCNLVEEEEKFEEVLGSDGLFKILSFGKNLVVIEADLDNLNYPKTGGVKERIIDDYLKGYYYNEVDLNPKQLLRILKFSDKMDRVRIEVGKSPKISVRITYFNNAFDFKIEYILMPLSKHEKH